MLMCLLARVLLVSASPRTGLLVIVVLPLKDVRCVDDWRL